MNLKSWRIYYYEMDQTEMSKYNVLELFGGCGGLGWGFKREGFTMAAYNELDPKIAETYKENFKGTECIIGDITKNPIKQHIYDCFAFKGCDIILGGPPCVAYSMSGHRNSRDPRGQLFRDYIEVVEKLQPKLFIMENVPGIKTIMHDRENLSGDAKKKADAFYKLESIKMELEAAKKRMSVEKGKKDAGEDHEYNENDEKSLRTTLSKIKKKIKRFNLSSFRISVDRKIINTFQSKGYKVESRLLNSADFGVPQRRKRIIFIGIRKDCHISIHFPPPTHDKGGENGLLKWKTVRQAIDDLKDLPEDKKFAHILSKHQPSFVEKIKNTPIGKGVYKKYSEAFFRCRPDEPSGTVKENHGGVFVHYEKNRVMTPRELARLQSFPDDFVFKGTKSCMLVQLGNAVPCGLSHALARNVKILLSR